MDPAARSCRDSPWATIFARDTEHMRTPRPARRPPGTIAALLLGIAVLPVGCAHAPLNARLERPLTAAEVSLERPRPRTQSDELVLVLAFSGGGVRAAALAYGVLEVLATIRVSDAAGSHRLLDNVTLVTSVSGGSFTAAYYGLYGERIFEDFEARFLKGTVGRKLWWRVLNPVNWVRLASSSFDRSDLAAELYDDILFHGATFADINGHPGPLIAIQATDLVGGNRLGFSAHTFGLICSDIAKFGVARAVAASPAFPIIFSPILLRNYAGTCDYHEPPWIRRAIDAGPPAGRRYQNARRLHAYADSTGRPWIYLVDGGIADNLGLHRVFDAISERQSTRALLRERGLVGVRRIAFMVANAQTEPATRWGALDAAPGLATMVDALTSVQINRYNFETIELLRRTVADADRE